MVDLARDFFSWVEALSPLLTYAILFAVAYGENIAPPIPGDALVVFAGYLVSTGKLDPVVSVLLAGVAGTLGFMTMFAIGRSIEGALLRPDRLRWIPKKRLARALGWVNRRGYAVVAANRFLSGLRSVIALASGMARLKAWRTTAYAGFSSIVWSGLMVAFGYWLGENWEVVSVGLRRYSLIVTILIVLFVLFQLRRYRRDRLNGEAAQPDVTGSFTDH